MNPGTSPPEQKALRRIVGEVAPDVLHRLVHLVREGVPPFRVVEREDGDRSVVLDDELWGRDVRHRNSS
jgi:hypothetical protein